jgi:hypothetical protein
VIFLKKLISLLLILLVLLLASCASQQGSTNISASELNNYEVISTKSEVNEGDFVYRLVTEKAEYRINESVKVFAELEYVGNREEVVIFHADSPFYFPMTEKTRNYKISYPMNQPLNRQYLKRVNHFVTITREAVVMDLKLKMIM